MHKITHLKTPLLNNLGNIKPLIVQFNRFTIHKFFYKFVPSKLLSNLKFKTNVFSRKFKKSRYDACNRNGCVSSSPKICCSYDCEKGSTSKSVKK